MSSQRLPDLRYQFLVSPSPVLSSVGKHVQTLPTQTHHGLESYHIFLSKRQVRMKLHLSLKSQQSADSLGKREIEEEKKQKKLNVGNSLMTVSILLVILEGPLMSVFDYFFLMVSLKRKPAYRMKDIAILRGINSLREKCLHLHFCNFACRICINDTTQNNV